MAVVWLRCELALWWEVSHGALFCPASALPLLPLPPGRKAPEWEGMVGEPLTDTNLSIVHWAAMRDTPEVSALSEPSSGPQPRAGSSNTLRAPALTEGEPFW